MYLVDTSVWVSYLRKQTNAAVERFMEILDNGFPFGITSLIYQVLLQGKSTRQDFARLVEYLSTQIFFQPKDKILTYQAAARLYFQCRHQGMTIRSTIDCLIAQIAIEHNLILLHNDKDFIHINKVVPALKL